MQGRPLVLVLVLVLVLALALVLVLAQRCPGETYGGRHRRAATKSGTMLCGRWIGSHHVMARAAMCAHLVVVRHEPTARVEARAQRVTSLTACHGTATFQHL